MRPTFHTSTQTLDSARSYKAHLHANNEQDVDDGLHPRLGLQNPPFRLEKGQTLSVMVVIMAALLAGRMAKTGPTHLRRLTNLTGTVSPLAL